TSDIQIDPPGALYHQHLVFSPDGNYLYFTDGADNLYRMPAFGGPKTRLLGGVSSPLSFSPDGKQIAFLRRDYPTHGESTLMLAEELGSAFAPQLWEVSYPAGSAHRITNELNRYEELSVSADARTVVTEQISQPSNIWVESKPGQTRQLTSAANGSYENLSW